MPLPPPAQQAPSVPPDTVVLTIGEEKITAAEFDHMIDQIPEQYRQRMRTSGRRQFAENIIRLKIMAQEGHRKNIENTPAYKAQLAFQAEQILANQYYQDLVAKTKVDEATAHAYYEEHKADYLQVKARHILIKVAAPGAKKDPKDPKDRTDEEALAKAKEIRQKLVDGADFETLAKAESEDAGSAAKGGEVGPFGKGRMAPPFEEEAFKIPVGELSQPVKTQYGYHIIKVESRQEKTFVEVRAEIERKLDADAVQKATADLKESAHVVMDPAYFGPPPPAMPPPGPKPAITIQPPPPAQPK